MHWIDTHTHLYLDAYKKDIDQVIKRAVQDNVKQLLLPNIDHSTIQQLTHLVKAYPQTCFPMMGLHPCSVKADYKEVLDIIYKELETNVYCAIGEIGLDYYWDTTYKKQQKQAFHVQVEWAAKQGLPIAVHCRKSMTDILEILAAYKDTNVKGVLHCFTGSLSEAQQLIELGFYLGIGGVVTFKNAGLDEVVKEISLEHIILETDSPFLTPTPYRGKRNESSYLLFIAERLAEIYHVSLEELARITTHNARKLFHQLPRENDHHDG